MFFSEIFFRHFNFWAPPKIHFLNRPRESPPHVRRPYQGGPLAGSPGEGPRDERGTFARPLKSVFLSPPKLGGDDFKFFKRVPWTWQSGVVMGDAGRGQ